MDQIHFEAPYIMYTYNKNIINYYRDNSDEVKFTIQFTIQQYCLIKHLQ